MHDAGDDASDAIVFVTQVSIARGERMILHDIDWTIRPREHWVLLGRNGSGKSTLLQVLHGELWPYRGRGTVRVLGYTYGRCDLHRVRREIGWVSHHLHERLYRHTPALNVVISGLSASIIRKKATDDERARALGLLERLGIADRAEQPYGLLSQGEQQRVLLARALLPQPKLLILDEPCASLDFIAREQFLAATASLMRDPHGPALIFVTHHPEEILPEFSHVLLLDEGRVTAAGPKREVLTAERLSAAYQAPLVINWQNDRPFVQLAPAGAP